MPVFSRKISFRGKSARQDDLDLVPDPKDHLVNGAGDVAGGGHAEELDRGDHVGKRGSVAVVVNYDGGARGGCRVSP
jgi:hypothetical protein